MCTIYADTYRTVWGHTCSSMRTQLYVCPHTTICISSFFYTCFLILLYRCSDTTICVMILLCKETCDSRWCNSIRTHIGTSIKTWYYYICVLILLYKGTCDSLRRRWKHNTWSHMRHVEICGIIEGLSKGWIDTILRLFSSPRTLDNRQVRPYLWLSLSASVVSICTFVIVKQVILYW